MSKAVAVVESNYMGLHIKWLRENLESIPPSGAKLYTTDHAEALANSAANLCNFLMQVGVHPLAIPRVDDLLSEIANYREETE